MKRILFTVLVQALFISGVFAQKTWDGGAGTNNWTDGNNWNPNGVPAATDAVTIGNGFTVVLNTSTTIASLTVGGGTSGQLTIGNGSANRTLTVTGNIIVNAGATFTSTGNGGNILNIGGNLTNNGIFTDNAGDIDVAFNGTSNQTISGTGATTSFNFITINNSGTVNNNVVEVTTSSFSAIADFLILTDGFFKLSTNITITPFTTTGYVHIPAGCGMWNNGGTLNTSGFEFVVEGTLRVTAGVTNIGSATDELLVYISGSTILIEGGTLNAVGSIRPDIVGTSTVAYTQSSGTLVCAASGTSSTTTGIFDISTTGSSFTMSGGSIIIVRANTSFTGADYVNLASTNSVTGGTIQIGNASTPASQTIDIRSTVPVFNLTINSANSPIARLITNNLTVLNTITINTGSTLNANNLNIDVRRDWTNSGTFTAGTGTVTFNGTSTQTISGATSTTFNNITFNKTSGGITLSQACSVNGVATFTSGIVTTTLTNLLTMNAGSAATGASVTSHVNGPMAKVGNTAFTFPVGNGTFFRTIGIGAPSSSSTFRAQFFRTNPVTAISPSTLGAGLTRISRCEYWNLDRTAGTGNATVTLSWGTNSGCGAGAYVNDLPTLRVARHTGAGGFWSNQGQTSATGTTAAGTVTSNTVTAFSPFALAAAGTFNPLPVELSPLTAVKSGGSVLLEFSNYNEQDIAYYEWMRSENGRDFKTFQTQSPRDNKGASVAYNLTDLTANEQAIYYRVKVVLNTSEELYSSIVKVSNSNVKDWAVLGNPVTNGKLALQLSQFENGKYDLLLLNSNGKRMMQQQLVINGSFLSTTIQLPQGINRGVYYLVLTGKGERMSKTIVIQ